MTAAALATVLVGFLVVVAVVVALLRDVLAAAVVFAAYSLAMAILWVVLQAPDVALTEAAVGAGVMTTLLLIAIVKTGRPAGEAVFVRDVSPVAIVVGVATAGVLVATVPALPAVGAADAPAFQRVVPYYLERAAPEFGLGNVVTAVLAGYRGFDTFGEVVVIVTAGIAAVVVLGREGF